MDYKKMFKLTLNYTIGLLFGVIVILTFYLMIVGQNSGYQAHASIDYVYAGMTGGNPSESDTWLVEQYCQNELALKTMYPEDEEKCNYILAQKQENKDV